MISAHWGVQGTPDSSLLFIDVTSHACKTTPRLRNTLNAPVAAYS